MLALLPLRHARAVPALLLLLGAALAHAADAAPSMPPARWAGGGLDIEVRLGGAPGVAAQRRPALMHYAVGLVAMPLAAIDPAAALGWPFYVVLGAPWQATFNARSSALAQALAAQPLPAAVVDALRAHAAQAPAAAPRRAALHIEAYGLATRSGRPLEAFGSSEDLCLAAQASLAIERGGSAAIDEPLLIAPAGGSPDAPPSPCLPLARWAADDAKLLHQHLAELAEILAALVLARLEADR